MLEGLNGDRQSIKRLVLTDPKPRTANETFDVGRDVTFVEWNKINTALRAETSIPRIARLAASASVLDKDRFEGFNLTQSILAKIEQSATRYMTDQQHGNPELVLNLLAYSRMIKPDSIGEFLEKYPKLKNMVSPNRITVTDGPLKESSRISNFMIVFAPDQPVPGTEDMFDKLFSPKIIEQTLNYGGVQLSARVMAMARIAFPNRFGELPLAASDWVQMRQHLDDLRFGGNAFEFAHHAYHMHILAAEEVRTTQAEGLIVVPQKFSLNLAGDSLVLPSRRRF